MANTDNPDDIEQIALTITVKNFIRLALMVFVTLLILGAIRKASHEILLIFTAFFFAIALNAPVSFVSRHLPGKIRGSRSVATSLSYLIVVILLGAFIASIVPHFVKSTENLAKAAPHLVSDLHNQNSTVGKFIREHHLEKQVNDLSNQLSDRLQHVGGTAFSTIQSVGSSFFSLLTILVLTFMMLVEGPRWVSFARKIVPHKYHDLHDRMTHDMYRVVTGFVNGQVILALIASVFISIAVFVLNISYPFALIVVIFICGLIPLVGHTIGAVIVTTVAATHSLTAAVIILLYYILYIAFENYIIQPRIQANSTNMSPLLVFMSVVLGVSFGGIFGALVAIPVAGCLRIAFLEYLRSAKIITTPRFDEATTETR